MHNNKPVVQALVLIGDEFQASGHYPIGATLRKVGKRIHYGAIFIDDAFVREPVPFESAVLQFDPVAFIRDATGLVEPFVICTRG